MFPRENCSFINVGLTALPDKRRKTDVVFLDLCEVFDGVLQNTFASELWGHRLDMDKEQAGLPHSQS